MVRVDEYLSLSIKLDSHSRSLRDLETVDCFVNCGECLTVQGEVVRWSCFGRSEEGESVEREPSSIDERVKRSAQE